MCTQAVLLAQQRQAPSHCQRPTVHFPPSHTYTPCTSILSGCVAISFHVCSYRTALKEHPNCPAEVRLGMGATAFKLGDLSLARAAFKRAAELDGGCADALLGLALVHFSSPNVQQVGTSDAHPNLRLYILTCCLRTCLWHSSGRLSSLAKPQLLITVPAAGWLVLVELTCPGHGWCMVRICCTADSLLARCLLCRVLRMD